MFNTERPIDVPLAAFLHQQSYPCRLTASYKLANNTIIKYAQRKRLLRWNNRTCYIQIDTRLSKLFSNMETIEPWMVARYLKPHFTS